MTAEVLVCVSCGAAVSAPGPCASCAGRSSGIPGSRGAVTVEFIEGPEKGKKLIFERHDSFVCGRSRDCRIRLEGDEAISGHHFLLEVNPPRARLQDLGSRNGTLLNAKRVGGERRKDASPIGSPTVELQDGDRIQVGRSVLRVDIAAGVPLAERSTQVDRAASPPRCVSCGADIAGELGASRSAEHACAACRKASRSDPLGLLADVWRKSESTRKLAFALDDYVMEGKVGKGGNGVVYRAKQRRTGERVAVKVIVSDGSVDGEARRLFRREVDVHRRLVHPGIVRLREHGSVGNAFYFIMDFCRGGNLEEHVRSNGGRLPLREARGLALGALDGLAYAHEQGFVHRDVKPRNILLDPSEGGLAARLADFGLAKSFEEAGFSGLSITGDAAGTPEFMPREQVTDFRYVKPWSDVYSMAATIYWMLTGKTPRRKGKDGDTVRMVLEQPAVPLRERLREAPAALGEVVDRALSMQPEDRYRDAGEFRRALAGAG